MKRRTFWIIDAVMYLLASIFSFINALKDNADWFRVIQIILCAIYLYLSLYYWIKALPFKIKKIKIKIEEEE